MSEEIELLILHRADLASTGLKSREQSWQGIKSEESKATFDWGSDLTITVVPDGPPRYILDLLPPAFRTGAWDYLDVSGDAIVRFLGEPAPGENCSDYRELDLLLRALLDDRQPWAFFFLADDQNDYEKVVRGNVDELIRRMRENLAEDHPPEGLIIVNLPESPVAA